MFVKTKDKFLHYSIGKVLEITTELYNQHPDLFEIIDNNKIEDNEHNKRTQPKMESRRDPNRHGY
jgi:hypothetical protein